MMGTSHTDRTSEQGENQAVAEGFAIAAVVAALLLVFLFALHLVSRPAQRIPATQTTAQVAELARATQPEAFALEPEPPRSPVSYRAA